MSFDGWLRMIPMSEDNIEHGVDQLVGNPAHIGMNVIDNLTDSWSNWKLRETLRRRSYTSIWTPSMPAWSYWIILHLKGNRLEYVISSLRERASEHWFSIC